MDPQLVLSIPVGSKGELCPAPNIIFRELLGLDGGRFGPKKVLENELHPTSHSKPQPPFLGSLPGEGSSRVILTILCLMCHSTPLPSYPLPKCPFPPHRTINDCQTVSIRYILSR